MSRSERLAVTLGVVFLLVIVAGAGLCTWAVTRHESRMDREQWDAMTSAYSGAIRTPQWSSDGEFLVANVGHDISIIDVATNESRPVFDDYRYRYSPLLSPDDHAIVYFRLLLNRNASRWEITDVNGRRPTVLERAIGPVTWSPDGSRLLYRQYSGKRLEVGNEETYPSVALFSESEPEISWPIRRLEEARVAAWSPDGTRIVFVGEDEQRATVLYVVKSDGTGKTIIFQSDGPVSAPAWTADGQLVFAAGERVNDILHTKLYQADADGQTLRVLANLSELEFFLRGEPSKRRLGKVSRVAPSPNALEVLLFDQHDDGGKILNYMGAGGVSIWKHGRRELTKIPFNDAYDSYAAWSPDSKRIAIFRHKLNEGMLYIVSPDGADYKAILAEDPMQPAALPPS